MINWKLLIINSTFIILLFVLMIACLMTEQYIAAIIVLVSLELNIIRTIINADDFIKDEE